MSDLTNIEALVTVEQLTGMRLFLAPCENVTQLKLTDTTVSVAVDAVEVAERRGEYRVIRTGRRLVVFTETDEDWIKEEITVWDETPRYAAVASTSKSVSFADHREQMIFEDMCYRPGTSKNPMDNSLVGAYHSAVKLPKKGY